MPNKKAIEAAAYAICRSGKFECGGGRCALVCCDSLGHKPAKCSHALRVHGDLAALALTAAAASNDDYNAGLSQAVRRIERYRDGVEESARAFPDAEPLTDQLKGMLNDLVMLIEKLKRPE